MARLASFCTGYGGLDAAVGQYIPGGLAWVADNDPDAGLVISAHFPGVPNLGDLKTLDWASAPGADVWAGGWPCQPFSQAGRRRGTADPRHIWPFIAAGVRARRPLLVVGENVAGHLTLGFDVVLADLAAAGYDAHWVVVLAAEVGAPHKRARLFIVAVRADQPAAVPAGQPVAIREHGGWRAPADTLFGPEPFTGRLPKSGSMVAGRIYAVSRPVPVPVLPTPDATHGRKTTRTALLLPGAVELLPTPAAGNFNDGETLESWQARQARQAARGINGNGMGTPLPIAVALLGTPRASDGIVHDSMEVAQRRAANGARHRKTLEEDIALLRTPTAQLGINGGSQHPDKRKAGGHGPTLADEIEYLLPTPNATDGQGGVRAVPEGRTHRGQDHGPRLRDMAPLLPTLTAADGERASATFPRGNPTLGGALAALLPTPNASDFKGSGQTQGRERDGRLRRPGDVDLAEAVALLPRASDGAKGGPNQHGSSGDLMLPFAVQPQNLLPTPRASDGAKGGPWGKYAPAIARWEAVTGRPVPAPTIPGVATKHRIRECAWQQGIDGWAAQAMIRLGWWGAVLNPVFVEWLMGLPEGHVTAVRGLSRGDKLRILGNGVVVQQASLALPLILADVPGYIWAALAAGSSLRPELAAS